MYRYFCIKNSGNYKEGEVYMFDTQTNYTFLVELYSLWGQYFCIQDNDEFKAGKVYPHNNSLNSCFIYICNSGDNMPSEKLLCVKDFIDSKSIVRENEIVNINLFYDFSFGVIDGNSLNPFSHFNKVYHHFISLAEYRNKQIDEILN